MGKKQAKSTQHNTATMAAIGAKVAAQIKQKEKLAKKGSKEWYIQDLKRSGEYDPDYYKTLKQLFFSAIKTTDPIILNAVKEKEVNNRYSHNNNLFIAVQCRRAGIPYTGHIQSMKEAKQAERLGCRETEIVENVRLYISYKNKAGYWTFGRVVEYAQTGEFHAYAQQQQYRPDYSTYRPERAIS